MFSSNQPTPTNNVEAEKSRIEEIINTPSIFQKLSNKKKLSIYEKYERLCQKQSPVN